MPLSEEEDDMQHSANRTNHDAEREQRLSPRAEGPEVAQLRKLVRQYGNKWTLIAQQMEGRTAEKCKSKVKDMRRANKWDDTPSTSRTAQDQPSQKQKQSKRSAAKRKRSASAEQSRKAKAPKLMNNRHIII